MARTSRGGRHPDHRQPLVRVRLPQWRLQRTTECLELPRRGRHLEVAAVRAIPPGILGRALLAGGGRRPSVSRRTARPMPGSPARLRSPETSQYKQRTSPIRSSQRRKSPRAPGTRPAQGSAARGGRRQGLRVDLPWRVLRGARLVGQAAERLGAPAPQGGVDRRPTRLQAASDARDAPALPVQADDRQAPQHGIADLVVGRDATRRVGSSSSSRSSTTAAHEVATAADRLTAAVDRPCLLAGAGSTAETTLATALLCFLLAPDDDVVTIRRAAATSGDSGSIACIAGAWPSPTSACLPDPRRRSPASHTTTAWPPPLPSSTSPAESPARAALFRRESHAP